MTPFAQNTPFNGPYYMHGQYAQSFIPSLIQIFNSKGILGTDNDRESLIDASINMNSSGDGSSTSRSVLVLNIKHPIVKYDYCFLGTKSFTSILKGYENDDSIAGVVLDVDSGGGQVYGTPEFFDFIKSYSKPIVSYTDGYMCSAAYYFSAPTKYIVANKRADHIGSIGAYASFIDYDGILEKLGANIHTMYATKSSEKNKDFREILENENYKPYIKNQLDPIVDTFHKDMKSARPNLSEEVFKGGTWGADVSLELGLIDEIGTLQTAIDKVFELSNANTNSPNNNGTMTKKSKNRNRIQTVLGYEEPLAVTDNGSYLNEEELDSIEAHLENQEGLIQSANDARTTAETNLKESQNSNAAVETALDQAIESSEIEVAEGATSIDKVTALQNHIASLGKQPGSVHTTVKESEEADEKHSYIDFSSPLYQN